MAEKFENSGKRWTVEDMTLILRELPTSYNRDQLSKILKRSKNAIDWIWTAAYNPTDILEKETGMKMVIDVKKKLGILDSVCMLTKQQRDFIKTTSKIDISNI